MKSVGWHVPFYLFGAVGLVWAVVWFLKVGAGRGPEAMEMPAHEPKLIPWRRLVGTPAVWAIVVAHFCANWLLYLLLAWTPSYFKTTFHVSLSDAGLLSAAPWLVSFGSANVAGFLADRMMRRGLDAGFVRKLMQSISLRWSTVFWLLPAQRRPGGRAVDVRRRVSAAAWPASPERFRHCPEIRGRDLGSATPSRRHPASSACSSPGGWSIAPAPRAVPADGRPVGVGAFYLVFGSGGS